MLVFNLSESCHSDAGGVSATSINSQVKVFEMPRTSA
jgi:hypothetical protein